jgi:hypothetical protein
MADAPVAFLVLTLAVLAANVQVIDRDLGFLSGGTLFEL